MASYGQAVPVAGARMPHAPVYGGGGVLPVAPTAPAATAPAGTFAPGTKIQVGSHRVIIQKYLSEGGFAHVYLVKMPTPVNGTELAVLKRVAVPDKEALRGMRTEVETMKRLKGHKAIVTYIDSHASELRNGNGYEVFLLMEYCNGGGLIDFMNTRLQHRLTEPEILKIFADVAEGVACMHYLKPPLLHRDLKVENVLITTTSTSKKFKLCDFGSAAPPRPAPNTPAECRQTDEDVQRHTTMQYRSPEMIDVYRKQPIDEKSDIWALGVLLYKLCYYTTPFEEQGQLAILNASYKFPSHPVFSDRLKRLIASMLRENPKSRPNIYQVLKEACAMQGREVPVKDIYTGKTPSEHHRAESTPRTGQKASSKPVVGAVFSPPVQQQTVIPEVERMRRGRPLPSSQPAAAARPSPSPARVTNGDPFAALDSKPTSAARDELSSKFPTLDEFTLLVESDGKFDFERHTPPMPSVQKNLAQRVTDRLADDAFSPSPATSRQRPAAEMQMSRAKPTASASPDRQFASPPLKSASAPPKPTEMSRASAIISETPELQAISSLTQQPVHQPTPTRPVMVSTGTNTTPPPERSTSTHYPPIYRFPPDDHARSSSVPRQQEIERSGLLRTGTPNSTNSRPGAGPRPPSFQSVPIHARHPSSSRPSLEGGRPSTELLEPIAKSRSTSSARPRPASTHLESTIHYLRGREGLSRQGSQVQQQCPRITPAAEPGDEANVTSDVDFLRSMEDTDPRKKGKPRQVSHHSKRSSLTSLGTGTKNILAGKFGDAFKRFETNTSGGGEGPPPPRTPSPLRALDRRRDLTPIAGSEATDGRSDDGNFLEEADDMSPEMRRELERRRLSVEEKRVAAAAAEYRQRVGSRPDAGEPPIPLPKSLGGVSRALSIQNKVQNLLEESSRSTKEAGRTAHGHGPYTDAAAAAHAAKKDDGRPVVPRKPADSSSTGPKLPSTAVGGGGMRRSVTTSGGGGGSDRGAAQRSASAAHSAKPAAPPKPTHLNAIPAAHSGPGPAVRPASPPKPGSSSSSISVAKTRAREHMVAVDLPGQPALEMSAAEREDYIRDFQKRFPSLTSFEMVERDLAAEAGDAGRGRAR